MGADGCSGMAILRGARLVTTYPVYHGCPLADSWISDFDEQKTYRLNSTTREYTVQKFSDVLVDIAESHELHRQGVASGRFDIRTAGVPLPAQSLKRAKRFEYVTTLRKTGQRKTLFGYDAHEVILTVTAVEAGKTLETDGGWVVTNTIWLGPRIPPLDDLVSALRRYARIVTKGVWENPFTQIEFPTVQFFEPGAPEHAVVGTHVVAEMDKLDGTVLWSVSVYEIERTAKEWKSAQDEYAAQQRRLAPSGIRVLGGSPPKRIRLVTLETEFQSLSSNVTEADVAIPAGFRKK